MILNYLFDGIEPDILVSGWTKEYYHLVNYAIAVNLI